MSSTLKSIILKDYLHIFEEYEVAEVLSPGMLVEVTSAGKIQKHSTAGGNAVPMFPIEDALQGKGIDGETFAVGDKARVWIPQRGDCVLALIADGESVTYGDFLESNGYGFLQVHTVEQLASSDVQVTNTIYSMPIVAQALETIDLSTLEGSESSLSSNSQYIKVRIV